MRLLLISALALSAMVSTAAPADAKKGTRSTSSNAYGYQARSGTARNEDSDECIRARDVDPAGNYAGYPCWAQWAFGPKRRGR
jgi:hypothetical protein